MRHDAVRPARYLHHAASPIDGSVYQYHAVDEYSSYGLVASGKTHTVDDWVTFLKGVTLDARANGHIPPDGPTLIGTE